MEEGLVAACSQLRLTEDEQETITLEDVVDENADDKAELSLIGKLFTQKPYNLIHMKNALSSAWRLAEGFSIRHVGDDLFVCEFFSKLDKNRILREGPWNFDKQLILFEPMSGNMQPNNMILKHCLVWVRVYNLPMNCRGKVAVTKLGTKLGRVLEVDGGSGDYNRYGRARVLLDVSKPIIRGTKVINPLGEQCWIPFKYERLQNFCYWCGMLDHLVADCEEKPEETEVSDWPYGPGLRATPRKKILMGNRQNIRATANGLEEQSHSASHSDNGDNPSSARRNLNLDKVVGTDMLAKENVRVQQVDAVLHGHGSDILQTSGEQVERETVEGLVDVRIQQVQIGTSSQSAISGQAKTDKNNGKEGSWTRRKTVRAGTSKETEVSNKKNPTKRDHSMIVDGDSVDFFSKKVRDGLSDRFEQFEISAETGEQSRRTQ
ncbi:uncharacterized protein LOC126664516 [Mercurialis annua]|uniref:uncharacterized protein LOC126664516 n=1 Tax=Mercurialis annua TaxID=3986 RepID=UPI00215DF6C7|nr:uncharacterized protein LOC126664516 [Mercurialis annua]